MNEELSVGLMADVAHANGMSHLLLELIYLEYISVIKMTHKLKKKMKRYCCLLNDTDLSR